MDSVPRGVRSTLNSRGCLIPQPYPDEKRNAVKGAFTAKGAVTDSLDIAIDYTLGVLPHGEFATRTVDDYGSSIPQPVDHDAIDVGILEKASIAYYHAAGKWYRIITSD